jgi:hypothetical protein
MEDLLAAVLGSTDLAEDYRAADEDEREVLAGAAIGASSPMAASAASIVLNRLADAEDVDPGDDPFIDTTRRLLDAGHDPASALGQMSMVMLSILVEVADDPDLAGDREEHARRLGVLPLPDLGEIGRRAVELAAGDQGVHVEELHRRLADAFGLDVDEQLVEQLLDTAVQQLVTDRFPSLTWLAGDRTVATDALLRNLVLTHVVTAEEVAAGVMDLSLDLPLLGCAKAPLHDGRLVGVEVHDHASATWHLPSGALAGVAAGDVVAVVVDDEGEVRITPLATTPPVDEALVAAVRQVVEAEAAEPGLPVPLLDVQAGLALDHRALLEQPQAPLPALVDATGFERRGTEVAAEPTAWRRKRRAADIGRIMGATDDDREVTRRAVELIDVVDALADGQLVESEDLAAALDGLADPGLLSLVQPSVLDVGGAHDPTEALIAAAATPRQRAAARHLAALQAELDGEALVAEQHLALAVEADGTWAPALDRLAWYAADRGDARTAVRLWRRAGDPASRQDAAEAERHLRATGPEPGRNDPCWCGSGRKFKRCHQGSPPPAPLPDRVGWLCRKASASVERHPTGEPQEELTDLVVARVGPNPAAWRDALSDPLLVDLLLTEGGWFEDFVEHRGPLLPDDEALLAASWLSVDRTVYEVLEVRPGEGLTLRDLRSGDEVVVRERSLTRTAELGMRLCARAVPDGETAQLVGAVVEVEVGREAELLDLLDEGDPVRLAGWFGAVERPPTVVGPQGQPLDEWLATLPGGGGDPRPVSQAPSPVDEDAIRDTFERRWCDEPVPALGGVTPRQAAADPTRRDQLERLIGSFERMPDVPGALTMRPARLRQLLGL